MRERIISLLKLNKNSNMVTNKIFSSSCQWLKINSGSVLRQSLKLMTPLQGTELSPSGFVVEINKVLFLLTYQCIL